MILPHLSPLPPLQIPYTIRVDKAFHTSRIAEQGSTPEPESGSSANPQCSVFDILVPLDDPVRSLYHSTMHSHANVAILSRLASLDDSLATIVQAVGHARAKHSFLSTMADDPFRFVRRWVSSQQHDLEILLGERMRSGDEDNQSEVWRKGGIDSVWAGDHARESVALWLARQRQR